MFALEGKHKKWKNVDKECYIVICSHPDEHRYRMGQSDQRRQDGDSRSD